VEPTVSNGANMYPSGMIKYHNERELTESMRACILRKKHDYFPLRQHVKANLSSLHQSLYTDDNMANAAEDVNRLEQTRINDTSERAQLWESFVQSNPPRVVHALALGCTDQPNHWGDTLDVCYQVCVASAIIR
jgi:hypothetical protein